MGGAGKDRLEGHVEGWRDTLKGTTRRRKRRRLNDPAHVDARTSKGWALGGGRSNLCAWGEGKVVGEDQSGGKEEEKGNKVKQVRGTTIRSEHSSLTSTRRNSTIKPHAVAVALAPLRR
jgi:hypothetical protein